VEAQTWTVIGILGAFSLGVLALSTTQRLGIDTRIDRLGERMNSLEQRMSGLEVRMDRVELRMDGLEQRMDAVELRMDRLEQRMDGLEQRMVEQFNEQNELLRALIVRMDAHETRHAS
jgi:chromosome segregation ATPase